MYILDCKSCIILGMKVKDCRACSFVVLPQKRQVNPKTSWNLIVILGVHEAYVAISCCDWTHLTELSFFTIFIWTVREAFCLIRKMERNQDKLNEMFISGIEIVPSCTFWLTKGSSCKNPKHSTEISILLWPYLLNNIHNQCEWFCW